MIGKAQAIKHGINDLRYISGEAVSKRHPEMIHRVCDNLLPAGLDAMGIWQSMEMTMMQNSHIKNTSIRIELSPPKEYTRDFTIDDWKNLWEDFVKEFDRYKETSSPPAHIAASKYTVWLHEESKGQVPHLHGLVCRLDEQGRMNNDHHIDRRAQFAAERVAIKRGWVTAQDVSEERREEMSADCIAVLCAMPTWSWSDYDMCPMWPNKCLSRSSATPISSMVRSSPTSPAPISPSCYSPTSHPRVAVAARRATYPGGATPKKTTTTSPNVVHKRLPRSWA